MTSQHDYARIALGQWCRNHGIYEIRQVLQDAAALAERCQSAEQLAEKLEVAGIAPSAPVPVVITEELAPPAAAAVAPEPEPRRSKRRAAADA